MKSAREIVKHLWESGKLRKMISPYSLSSNSRTDIELHRDFEQELVTILLEYPDKRKIIQLAQKGELEFFISGIIKNQLYSKSSPYYYKYGNWEGKRVQFEPNYQIECI